MSLALGPGALLACSSPPPANPPAPEVVEREESSTPAIAEAAPSAGCDAYAFQKCTSACSSRDCLDWCAGTSCLDLAAELYACAIPGEERYLDEHPEPALEELPPGPDADPEMDGYAMIDPESEERYYEWEVGRDDAMHEHWIEGCVPACVAGLDTESEEDPSVVCDDLQLAAYRWKRYQPPKPEKRADPGAKDRIAIQAQAGILGVMSAEAGAFGMMSGLGMFGGSSMRLDFDAAKDFEHRFALGQLIRSGAALGDLSTCVPGMNADSKPAQYKIMLTFDVHGEVDRAVPEDGSSEGRCVAERIAQKVRLPEPALRGLPTVQVDVTVAPEVEMSDAWGGLVGTEVGEAYGVGGLGLRGTGRGGGGSGEGTIDGIGTIGSGGGGRGGTGYGKGASGLSTSSAEKKPAKTSD